MTTTDIEAIQSAVLLVIAFAAIVLPLACWGEKKVGP